MAPVGTHSQETMCRETSNSKTTRESMSLRIIPQHDHRALVIVERHSSE